MFSGDRRKREKLIYSGEVIHILKIGRVTLNKWIDQGHIKYYKHGRLKVFNREDIEAFKYSEVYQASRKGLTIIYICSEYSSTLKKVKKGVQEFLGKKNKSILFFEELIDYEVDNRDSEVLQRICVVYRDSNPQKLIFYGRSNATEMLVYMFNNVAIPVIDAGDLLYAQPSIHLNIKLNNSNL